MITAGQRNALLLADRTRDAGIITAAIARELAANPATSLLDCEMAFRDAAASAYVIADGDDFRIVIGMAERNAALVKAGLKVGENWQMLKQTP